MYSTFTALLWNTSAAYFAELELVLLFWKHSAVVTDKTWRHFRARRRDGASWESRIKTCAWEFCWPSKTKGGDCLKKPWEQVCLFNHSGKAEVRQLCYFGHKVSKKSCAVVVVAGHFVCLFVCLFYYSEKLQWRLVYKVDKRQQINLCWCADQIVKPVHTSAALMTCQKLLLCKSECVIWEK